MTTTTCVESDDIDMSRCSNVADDTISAFRKLLNVFDNDYTSEDVDAPPSKLSICVAAKVIADASVRGVQIVDVDRDAIGGVAVFVKSATNGRRVWFSIKNDGTVSVTEVDSVEIV